MPIKNAAKKALRQNAKHHARNAAGENKIKNLVKEVKTLVLQKKAKDAKNLLPQIYQALDKAAKTGIIKKNTASRTKSRITKLIVRSE